MCNFIIINILGCIILYFYYLKYRPNTFIDFINDEYIKNRNNKILINDNKINNSSQKDEKYYINKINELENKIKTLENKIKEMEIKIKEKDKIINENINNNKYINNNIDSKTISELEEEIRQLKAYILSPGEKLISIKFISMDQKINFSIAVKNNDIFSIIENKLYNYYPEYRKYDNYFLVGGRKIYKNITIRENKIKDKDVLTLTQFDENS